MKRVIRFTSLRFLMISLSVLLILAGAAGLYLRGGLNLGIDFTAGLTEQIQIKPEAVTVAIDEVRGVLSGIGRFDLQVVDRPEKQEFIVKVIAPGDEKDFQEKMEKKIFDQLAVAYGPENIVILQSDFVGPRYSRGLVGQTISITMVALVLILLYTGFRFHFIYAIAAVLCLVHDVLFMFGVIAVFQFELTTTTIAAILTIIGYSLNDTIVIFDRVRENRGLMRDADFETIINTSITQSLSRTLLTSLTTLLAVATIYIFGTAAIKDFALNLIIGVVVGTYSTIFIASPIVLGWQRFIEKRRKKRDLKLYGRPQATALAPEARERLEEKKIEEKKGEEKEAAPEPVEAHTRVTVTRVQPTRVQPGRKKKKKKKR